MRLPIINETVAVSAGTPDAADPYNSGIRLKQDNTVAYVTTTKTGATFANGVLVASNGAMVIVDATSSVPSGSTYANGLLVDPDGAVCASTGALAIWSNGLPITANGALKTSQAGADVWLSASSWVPASGSSGWAGYTLRTVVDASVLPAASKLRFTLTSFLGSGGFTVKNMYVGIKAAAGDAYDFAATPIQATFNSGSAGVTVANGASIVTDPVVLSITDAQSIVIAVAFVDSGVALSAVGAIPTKTGWSSFNKLADDAATVDATGYTTSAAIYLVTQVEYVA